MIDLFAEFAALAPPSVPGAIAVHAVRAPATHRVGLTPRGTPVVLLELKADRDHSAPRRLANLSYSPPADVSIIDKDGASRTSRFAVLELLATEQALCRYFLRVVESVLLEPAVLESEATFERALDSVVSLFRALGRPGRRTVQGVWAELAIVLWSQDPAVTLASWHSSTNALYDFTSGNEHLEVKGVASALREHHFRREQLLQTGDGRTLIASMLLEEHPDGSSILDLIERVRERLPADLEINSRLESIVASGLGQEWRASEQLRYDRLSARKSLLVFEGNSVPSLPGPIPAEIKNIHFTLDLSTTSAANFSECRNSSAFFAAVLPQE